MKNASKDYENQEQFMLALKNKEFEKIRELEKNQSFYNFYNQIYIKACENKQWDFIEDLLNIPIEMSKSQKNRLFLITAMTQNEELLNLFFKSSQIDFKKNIKENLTGKLMNKWIILKDNLLNKMGATTFINFEDTDACIITAFNLLASQQNHEMLKFMLSHEIIKPYTQKILKTNIGFHNALSAGFNEKGRKTIDYFMWNLNAQLDNEIEKSLETHTDGQMLKYAKQLAQKIKENKKVEFFQNNLEKTLPQKEEPIKKKKL